MTLAEVKAILTELGAQLRTGGYAVRMAYYEVDILRDRWTEETTAENWAALESRAAKAAELLESRRKVD